MKVCKRPVCTKEHNEAGPYCSQFCYDRHGVEMQMKKDARIKKAQQKLPPPSIFAKVSDEFADSKTPMFRVRPLHELIDQNCERVYPL